MSDIFKKFDSRFLFWISILLGGFCYVSVVFCGRANPLLSRSGSYIEIIKLLAVSPLLYLLGAEKTVEPLKKDDRSILLWNVSYLVLFFIGLHWYYLQYIKQINFSVTAADFHQMPALSIAIFALCSIPIGAVVTYHIYLSYKEKILLPYLGAFFGSVFMIIVVSLVVKDNYYFHIHHYFIAALLIPFARFKTPISMASQALLAGTYVEGTSEWVMASLWVLR